jgi:hypothetical protein
MHFCKADIALGGGTDNIYHAGYFAPVSWPEVLLLQFLHGDDAVNNVEPFAQVDQAPKAERRRLLDKYGEKAILDVFARQNPAEMEAPRARLAKGQPWLNPLTLRQEIVGENSTEPDGSVVEEEPIAEVVEIAPAEEPLEYYDAPPEPTRRRR